MVALENQIDRLGNVESVQLGSFSRERNPQFARLLRRRHVSGQTYSYCHCARSEYCDNYAVPRSRTGFIVNIMTTIRAGNRGSPFS